MIKSPWNIDNELGLKWYSVDSEGIGGILRSIPEDFRVEELAEHNLSSGPYLICRMQKTNWDQHRAIKAIASGLSISHQRLNFAGTKDKRAVTTQFISFYKISEEEINSIRIPGIILEPVGYTQHPISLGDLEGNRFNIKIREIKSDNISDNLVKVTERIKEGIPNYVGYQRFGVRRPVTHLIGMEILKGNYEEAVRIIVGKPGNGMDTTEMEARVHYYETGNPAESLHLFPVRLSLERSVLHYLVSNPSDYKGALLTLPRTLRSMYVSAVQSWIFNHVISLRIEEGRDLAVPEIGDRLIWPDGRTDTVTPATLTAAGIQVKRKRVDIAILLPGSKYIPGIGSDDRNCDLIMQKYGITSDMFKSVSSILETSFVGSFRQVNMASKISYDISENNLSVNFDLPPGQYATTILREIMKTDPISMV